MRFLQRIRPYGWVYTRKQALLAGALTLVATGGGAWSEAVAQNVPPNPQLRGELEGSLLIARWKRDQGTTRGNWMLLAGTAYRISWYGSAGSQGPGPVQTGPVDFILLGGHQTDFTNNTIHANWNVAPVRRGVVLDRQGTAHVSAQGIPGRRVSFAPDPNGGFEWQASSVMADVRLDAVRDGKQENGRLQLSESWPLARLDLGVQKFIPDWNYQGVGGITLHWPGPDGKTVTESPVPPMTPVSSGMLMNVKRGGFVFEPDHTFGAPTPWPDLPQPVDRNPRP